MRKDKKYKGYIIGNRIYVPDIDQSREIWSLGFYGKPLGVPKPKSPDFDSPLLLDFLEAVYLYEKDLLEIYNMESNKELNYDELIKIASERYDDFKNKYIVYKDLRDRGLVVISGLKFGVDFAVYRKGPGLEHAPYLVDVISPNTHISGDELVRAGRLATSVRKRFVLAIVYDKKVRYLLFKWFKP